MQRTARLPLGNFWRYNYQIIAGSGYWMLAIPVAASQVVTLWMMALSSDFSQTSATRIGELMTPVLGAFLAAHSLAPEYRSGVGAVLACKPVSLGRVLSMRAALGMLFALLLTFITLLVCSVGLKPIDIWPPLTASIPGLWFLSTLALLFATIFRNPIGGFAVALALWSLDFSLGFGIHPLLSTQGLTAAAESDPLARFWAAGKGAQIVVGAALWYVHTRQLQRLCRPPEKKDVSRIVLTCCLVILAYCASGAAGVVAYAHSQRGNLGMRDSAWLRRYLQVYGPIPVAQLFGPVFSTLVTDPASRREGESRPARVIQLEQALQRWPRSIWADSLAFELAGQVEQMEPERTAEAYLVLADRYPRSPFAPKALRAVMVSEQAVPDEQRLAAARRLLKEHSNAREAEDAAGELRDHYPGAVNTSELLAATQTAQRVGPEHRRPEWLLRQAELEVELGRTAEARQHAEEALKEAHELETAARKPGDRGKELQPHLGRIGTVAQGAGALLERLRP